MDVVKMDSDCAAHGDGAQELLHVLAVDDSLVDRKLIERLFKLSCCKVTAVESGTRALQYLGLDGEKSSVGLDDLKVNLIITDYSMPGMTGFELLQKIKGSAKSKEIPVVIMSSENILARIDRCLEEGAEDYLLKPVKLADVQRLRDFTLRGETKDEKDITSCKRKTADDKCSSLSPPSPSPLFAPSLLNSDNPLPSSFAPSPLNCDNLMSSFATSPLNCDTPMSPMLVSAESHQLLTKRPSLLVASD